MDQTEFDQIGPKIGYLAHFVKLFFITMFVKYV